MLALTIRLMRNIKVVIKDFYFRRLGGGGKRGPPNPPVPTLPPLLLLLPSRIFLPVPEPGIFMLNV